MIYTLIISLLIEKPFYLLSPQSFLFQLVSEFIDIFVKFSNFMSRGGAFHSLLCPEGSVFVHNDCPGGGGFLLTSSLVLGFVPGMMVMDELDTCIMYQSIPSLTIPPPPWVIPGDSHILKSSK